MSTTLAPLRPDYRAELAMHDFGPMFDQFKVTYGMALEFIQDTLYDTPTYTSATTTKLAIFGGNTDPTISNMVGSTLPDRTGFLVLGLTLKPFLQPRSTARAASGAVQTGVINDTALLTQSADFNLKLLDKDYSTVPLDLIPAGSGIWGVIATEGATSDPGGIVDWAVNGQPDARNIYTLEEALFIPPLIQIQGTLNWRGGAVTLVSGNTKLRFCMHGLKVRPVQ